MSDTSRTSSDKSVDTDMSFTFLLGRAQKIATALYLVSGLFHEREPLRGSLREQALALLSDMRAFSDNPASHDQRATRIRTLGEHILSLSDLASRTGLMSSMNAEFIRREVESFVRDVSLWGSEKGNPALEQMLKDSEEKTKDVLPLLPSPVGYKGQSKGQSKGRTVARPKSQPTVSFGDFKHMTGPIKDIIPSGSTQGNGTDRKEKILKIIKEKGALTIKDIAGVAPEYSEKTIQRDLVDMVGSGQLKKKGERRWTVYYV